VRGRLSGRGRRQRCRRLGARENGGTSDHAISGVTGNAAAGGAGRRVPWSVHVAWRRTGATVAMAGTPTRARWGVGGAGSLVGAAADRLPAVLVAGGRAPTHARGVCRARVEAAVVTPMTKVVRPSAAPAGRPGALSPRTMGRERLLEHSNRMCLGSPVERHRRT